MKDRCYCAGSHVLVDGRCPSCGRDYAAERRGWIEALEWALHNPETIRIVDTLVKLRAEKEKGR